MGDEILERERGRREVGLGAAGRERQVQPRPWSRIWTITRPSSSETSEANINQPSVTPTRPRRGVPMWAMPTTGSKKPGER